MWNCLDLKCPSDDLAEYRPQDRYLTEELRNFVTVLSSAADTLTSENPLWTELEVLKNIQRKYKRILHCDRCLVFLHRVGHCLKKMVLLNLSKSYLDLAEKFLDGLQDASMAVHLPSRQQLEFVLIRTLTASKLVCEGIKYSRDTFCFLIQKLKVGHLILDLVMTASVIARLNVLLRATLEQISCMYKQVLSWRYKLKKGDFQWENKLELPQDLGEWLKTLSSGYLEPFPMSEAEVGMLSNYMTSNDENNVPSNGNKDSDSESVVLVEEVQEVQMTDGENATKMDDIDYGEVVPRTNIKKWEKLTHSQRSLLQKIVQVQSLSNLEKLWEAIRDFSSYHFPKKLTEGKKRVINRLFSQIKTTVTEKKYNKVFKNEPMLIKNAHLVFCKHLGFTQDHIEMCKNGVCAPTAAETDSNDLVPVKTLKDLKILYNKLCKILEFTNEIKKQRKLKRFFKQRRKDIMLLKQNGEKVTAKKLIFCTSKLLLTLCRK